MINFLTVCINWVLICCFVFGCVHNNKSSNVSKNLDVNFKHNGLDSAKASSNSDVPTSIIVDWKEFFKPFPDDKEMKRIAQKIDFLSQESNPNIEHLLIMARNYLVLGKLKAAEASLLKVLRYEPNNLDAALELAQLYLNKKDFEKSFNVLQDLKKQIIANPEVNNTLILRYKYILAVVYMEFGDVEQGRKILTDLISIDKTFTPAYLSLAFSYFTQEKMKVAEFIVRKGLSQNPDEPGFYNILGLFEQKKNNLILAKNYFDKALSLQKTYVPALVNRANISIINGELEAAQSDLKKALIYSPVNIDAHISLSICQKKLGLVNLAKDTLEKAMEIDADNPLVRLNYGILILENFDKPDIAMRYFNEVLQIKEASLDIKNIARSYINNIKSASQTNFVN